MDAKEVYYEKNITIITSNITLYADWEMISSGDGGEGTYYSGITATSGESLINQLNALAKIKQLKFITELAKL